MLKCVALLLVLICENGLSCLELKNWSLRNENEKIKIPNLSSPVDVYSALYERALIGCPLQGYNDVKYRWIGHDNWTFVSEPFSIDQSQSITLYVSGLDISPSIFLNNQLIGTTFSEFVARYIPINPSILRISNNVLKLKFYSPLLLANITAAKTNYSVAPNCWPDEFHGECHINFLRKTQASFGWDWGPAIPTVGIRGQVELVHTNTVVAKIRNVKLLTKTNSNCSLWSAKVELNVFVLLAEQRCTLCVLVQLPNLHFKQVKCADITTSGVVKYTIDVPLSSDTLKLWWPYEIGTPVLYLLSASVLYNNRTIDSSSQYVGFRYVSLNQSQLPNNYGRIYQFYVNCKAFFIKGTNWVPRTYMTVGWNNRSYIEFLLNSVRITNMNTIRLWGGGKPETEHFYSVADRLGLMVWHDLMFACALYPNDNMFTTIVGSEVSEIVSNLQRHPSILVWSGNNEIEVLIAQGWYNTTKMDSANINRYYNLFGQVIRTSVTLEDPYIPFILSSPSNGIESEKRKGVAKDPQSPYFGDVHFYAYDGDLWNSKLYPVTRMTTEFGFQSLPNMGTWRALVLSESDWEIDGPLMRHVQHHPDGNHQLIAAVKHYFGKPFPDKCTNASDQYSWFSYLSQINQAVILKVHINKLRSSQCTLTTDGIGLTRGAMYWQLNDNWIAPTWSSIDYFGQWKLSHYFVKKSFSPERVSIVAIDKSVTVTVILPNDFPQTQYELLIICEDISQKVMSSLIGQKSIRFNSTQSDCNVKTVLSMDIINFLGELNCVDTKKCLFVVQLKKNNSIISDDSTMLVHPLDMTLPSEVATDRISVEIQRDNPDYSLCRITMRFRYIHFFATLTTTTWGVFNDNGMHLRGNNVISVTFDPWIRNANEFFNCSSLQVAVRSLNGLFV